MFNSQSTSFSADALWEKYPGWSPYVYSANNPILFLDNNGKAFFIDQNLVTVDDGDIQDNNIYLTNDIALENARNNNELNELKLSDQAYKLPNSAVLDEINKNHESRQKNSEGGSVGTYEDFFFGGISKPWNIKPEATEQVNEALGKAEDFKSCLLFVAHDQPRSNENPSGGDYSTMKNLKYLYGIIVSDNNEDKEFTFYRTNIDYNVKIDSKSLINKVIELEGK